MAKCANCGKAPQVGNNVSHAKNRTARFFRPNLQKATTLDAKTGKRVQRTLCTKCIKAMGKLK